MDKRTTQLHIHADAEALFRAAAEHCISLCLKAIEARGVFHIALAGGSTPRALYQLLASPPYCERLPWEKIHIWFGDERSVPHDHIDSNYRMARESLLEHVSLPAAQIHAMTARPAHIQEDAAAYAALLDQHLPDEHGRPCFDLILLGMGPDGHTASLFPDTDILQQREANVAAVFVDKLNNWRISLTLPVLDQARALMFMVNGEGKAPMVKRILQPEGQPPLPIQLIQPHGECHWHLDDAAAAGLEAP